MTYKILWSLIAQQDLESAIDFIAFDHPINAEKLLRKIRSKAGTLRSHPKRGRLLPELSHIRGLSIRELLLSPWRLMYRIKSKKVEILAFFDGRRDLEEILYERLTRLQ